MADARTRPGSTSNGKSRAESMKSLADIYRVMDNLSPAVFAGLATVDGKVVYANQSALSAIGATIDDVKGKPVESTPWLAHSDIARKNWMEALASAANGVPARFEFSYEAVENGSRVMDLTVRPAADDRGTVRYIVTTAQDVTDQRRIEQLLGLTRSAIDRAKIAMLQILPSGLVHYANHAACELLGYTSEDLRGLAIGEISKRIASVGWETVWNQLKERRTLRYEETYLRANQQEVPVDVAASYGRLGADEYAFGFIADLTERKKAEQHIHFLAHFDDLTGLPNRRSFLQMIGRYVSGRAHDKAKIAVVISDVERFWIINDTLGRAESDELLRQIAQRFRHYVRGRNRLARLGADQFGLVISGIRDEKDVEGRINQKLESVFHMPFHVGEHELRVSAKFGIALFPRDGSDSETLFQKAEAALNSAKETFGKYRFYDRSMAGRSADRLKLENKLRMALDREAFVLHYQPKVNSASRRIEGVEALLRWNDPEDGPVSPIRFISVLEETGLIVDVGNWVLQQAMHDYLEWKAQGLAAPRIAVNVSVCQLQRPDFVQSLRNALEKHETRPCIDLELTETMLMDDVEGNIEKLSAIRAMGCRIGIDDFGTGYSSLGYLAKLPVQALKIDRSFVSTMLEVPNSRSLVAAIISMAHALKLLVVAEGVETKLQAQALEALGCDQMQGYFFSRPLPADELAANSLERGGTAA